MPKALATLAPTILAFFVFAPILGVVSVSQPAIAATVATTGSIVLETNPFPAASDTEIFVFDEQQGIRFVRAQALDFGAIAAGTIVDSHYVQFDTLSPTGVIGAGSVTFDGAILGVITSTAYLNADLGPDVAATADQYFGLASILGDYPAGAPGTEQFRGLGSPLDRLAIELGSNTLEIRGLDITTPGALDGIRVFTAVPEPGTLILLGLGLYALRVFQFRPSE